MNMCVWYLFLTQYMSPEAAVIVMTAISVMAFALIFLVVKRLSAANDRKITDLVDKVRQNKKGNSE